MKDGILALPVRSEGLARDATEFLEIPLEATDPVHPVLDLAAVGHHDQGAVAK